MLRDVCDPLRFPRYFCRFQSSPFRQDIEDFGIWLTETGYRSKILHYLSRLDRTLRAMPKAAPGASYTVAQLQTSFRRYDSSRRTFFDFRTTLHCFQRFLSSRGRLIVDVATPRFGKLCAEYCQQLAELRGFTSATIHHHRAVIEDFLNRSISARQSLSVCSFSDFRTKG